MRIDSLPFCCSPPRSPATHPLSLILKVWRVLSYLLSVPVALDSPGDPFPDGLIRLSGGESWVWVFICFKSSLGDSKAHRVRLVLGLQGGSENLASPHKHCPQFLEVHQEPRGGVRMGRMAGLLGLPAKHLPITRVTLVIPVL